MRKLLKLNILALVLGIIWALSAGTVAIAQDALAACQSLNRSNIDCGCVASRVDVFDRVSPSEQAREVIHQSYLYALGLENTLEPAFEALMSNPMQAIAAAEAYDSVGGQPSSIQEFEQGCVIQGAEIASLPQPSSSPAAQNYTQLCSSIASGERWCSCTTARIEATLGQPDADAYLWGMADVRTVEPEDRERSYQQRGAQMGLSGDAFEALLTEARASYSQVEEQDSLYCEAMTWADTEPGLSTSARSNAGFEPGVAGQLGSGQTAGNDSLDTSSDAVANAREIVARSCASNGNSEHYCACYMRDFEARVVAPSSPDVALAWAVNFGAEGGISASERMSFAQSLPQSAMQEAGMLFAQTSDIGQACTQNPAGATGEARRRPEGTPRERMERLCLADGADAETCSCAAGRMEAAFPAADFELIVEIREADARGEDDPLAAVAAERGLSADEAREALENNPAIIRGTMMMGQSLMQCMGGMPDLPAGIPGIPGGGGQ